MDFIKNAVGGGDKQTGNPQQPVNTAQGGQSQQGGGFLSGIGSKINSAAGGGKESEAKEDYLDKGMHNRENQVSCIQQLTVSFPDRSRLCSTVYGRWRSEQRVGC